MTSIILVKSFSNATRANSNRTTTSREFDLNNRPKSTFQPSERELNSILGTNRDESVPVSHAFGRASLLSVKKGNVSEHGGMRPSLFSKALPRISLAHVKEPKERTVDEIMEETRKARAHLMNFDTNEGVHHSSNKKNVNKTVKNIIDFPISGLLPEKNVIKNKSENMIKEVPKKHSGKKVLETSAIATGNRVHFQAIAEECEEEVEEDVEVGKENVKEPKLGATAASTTKDLIEIKELIKNLTKSTDLEELSLLIKDCLHLIKEKEKIRNMETPVRRRSGTCTKLHAYQF
uniref:RPAP1_N domain-containing protein n=1 Tax=Rhabditophanes sp. KR3021 TaxID=114890 RepID=A0AC35TUR3_9BILA